MFAVAGVDQRRVPERHDHVADELVDGAPVGSFTVQTFRDDVGTWGQVQWAAMETASAALAQEWRKGDAVAAVNMPRSYVLV